jgi:integrase
VVHAISSLKEGSPEQKKVNPKIMETPTTTDAWAMYIYSLKSPVSKQKYPKRLAKFFAFAGLPQDIPIEERSKVFVAKATSASDVNWAFNTILKFIMFQLERVNRKEIVVATVRGYLKSIKLFCEVAELPIAWRKITRGLPREKRFADDRAPTIEEIRRLAEYPDRRIKAIIYSMASGGFRVGAWDYLKWGHVIPIERNGKIVAAKVIIYSGEDEEYFTFISHEAYNELAKWMEFRQHSGEQISTDSWLMRDLFDTKVRRGQGKIGEPRKLQTLAVKRLVERAHWAQGLRTKLQKGKKRHPYQTNHGFRKWFKTRCEMGGMKPINIETLMGHSTGISDSYYRPTEHDLLEDYLKVVDVLTISGENHHHLEQEIARLKAQSDQADLYKQRYAEMRLSLDEKDETIKGIKEQIHRIYKELYEAGIIQRISTEATRDFGVSDGDG